MAETETLTPKAEGVKPLSDPPPVSSPPVTPAAVDPPESSEIAITSEDGEDEQSCMVRSSLTNLRGFPNDKELTNSSSRPVLSSIKRDEIVPCPTPDTACNPKSPSSQIVVKSSSTDGYNWRKYGQKQVKSSETSRSYYKCTNASCPAKKKVERCPDGRETEIIYSDNHNHDPPQKPRFPKERVQSLFLSGENESLDVSMTEVSESNLSTSKTEHGTINLTHEDVVVKSEADPDNEPNPKRRVEESNVPPETPVLKTVKEHKVVVQSAAEAGNVNDGYRWRKYGQKFVKGNTNPRSYYRCTHEGCPVRKHVERAADDAKAIIITYEGKHSHVQPPLKSGTDQPTTAIISAISATNTDKSSVASLQNS